MKQIVIEVEETGEPGQYKFRTRWDHMEQDTFETILQILHGAAGQVAHTWANVSAQQAAQQGGRIQVPGFVVNGGRA